MSRSKIETKEQIATRYFEWKSESKVKKDGEGHVVLDDKDRPIYEYDGYFEYFDGEKKVKQPLPFRFIPLEILATIKGFDKANACGIFSNEIKYTKEQPLTVRSWKGGEIAKGLYQDIIGEVDQWGGKYCKSVYIGFFIDDELVICNIQVHGAALFPFMEYENGSKEKGIVAHKNLTSKGAMQVKSFALKTTGSNTYAEPVFEELEITPETDAKAKELDVKLQEYLTYYFAKTLNGKVTTDVKKEVPNENKERMQPNRNAATDTPSGGDEEIPLVDDLPFLVNPNLFKNNWQS